MNYSYLPCPASPLLILSSSGTEEVAAAQRQDACGKRGPGALGEDVGLMPWLSSRLAGLEAGERGGSAGCATLGPVSFQPHQSMEAVVWMGVSYGMRCCLEHGNYQEVPCFLLDGFHWDEHLAAVGKVWTVGKGMLQCLAAVLVKAWEEYVKAKNEERGARR